MDTAFSNVFSTNEESELRHIEVIFAACLEYCVVIGYNSLFLAQKHVCNIFCLIRLLYK